MLKLSAAVVIFAGSLASAQDFETSGPGPYDNASIWQSANGNPTAQKTVPFDLWYSGSDDGNNGPQWQWEVSVATAQVSDSETPNAQQLNQIYAFSWPNGGSLPDAVAVNPSNLNQSAFCVTVVESLFPKPRTDNYNSDTEDNASDGSCKYPLRTDCVDAIVSRIMERPQQDNGCRATDFDLGAIRQCEWSFEQSFQGSTYNLLGPNIASTAANGTFPIQSGEGFAHITTDTYDGSNTTYLDSAESRLHMVIIESGNIVTPLCLRINEDSDVGTLEGAAPAAGVNGWLAGALALFVAAYLF